MVPCQQRHVTLSSIYYHPAYGLATSIRYGTYLLVPSGSWRRIIIRSRVQDPASFIQAPSTLGCGIRGNNEK